MGSTASSLFGITSRRKAKEGLIKVQTDYLEHGGPTTPEILPEAITAAHPIETPKPPPSAFNAAAQAGQAMSDAARRYRRQRGAGLAANTSNGAMGDPSAAPTFRKQLLGR